MLFKASLILCLLQVVFGRASQSGYWRKIASNQCVGARNNNYREFGYYGSNTFITALKLVHKKGRVGCSRGRSARWGCDRGNPTSIIVTDTRNRRMYPHPSLVRLQRGGKYDLPGYGLYSPQLVFSDPGFHYLYYGQRMRIWYGEDLFNYTEKDNHGFTCMDVYVFIPTWS